MSPPASLDAPRYRWRLAPPPPPELRAALPGLHPLLLAALGRRGLASPEAARAFLAREAGDDNPFRLAGMAEAVARLRAAIRAGERVAVYGDYDADGVTATALLLQTLRALGAEACHHIPHRARDGYGVHGAALDALARRGVRVVVTVDCGIRSVREVAEAARQGLDVIVTDHHVLPETLPEAVAVLNPRRPNCRYGFTELAGVGLAFKLAQALLRAAARSDRRPPALAEAELLDLVALGTVADVVPLVGENRSLVHRGLGTLASGSRPGLRALLAEAGVAAASLSTQDLGFRLGPRLNAAGRMDDADAALGLLLAGDEAQARPLAAALEARNAARRAALAAGLDEATRSGDRDPEAPLVWHDSPTVALGVVGLVAGRLAERAYRPAVVARVEGELARGSARSIPEFDITAALAEMPELLLRFGGHRKAAGFTARTEDLPALRARLGALAGAALEGLDRRPVLDIDAELGGEALDWPLHESLAALEPTGEGNPPALLLWRAAPLRAARLVGDGHLKLSLAAGADGGPVEAIAFGQGSRLPTLGPAADLVFSLQSTAWRGNPRLELKVLDLAPPTPLFARIGA